MVSALNAPDAHPVHTEDVDAEKTLLYAPAAHAVQFVAALAALLYVPGAHAVQGGAPCEHATTGENDGAPPK